VEPRRDGGNLRKRLGLALGPVACAVVLLRPVPGGLGVEAWRMAGVALWMAIWWVTEAVPIPVTALLPLPLFPALGILSSGRTAAHYGNHLIFLFFGGFVLALALERWDLHRRVALTIVAVVGGGPRRLLLGFMVGSAFLSMWMSNTAATLVMLPIGIAAVRTLGAGARYRGERGPAVEERVVREFGALLMLGLAYSASIGGTATLIGTPTNLAFAAAVRTLFPDAPEIGFVRWMGIGVPFAGGFLVLLWGYLAWPASGIDLGRLRSGDERHEQVRRQLREMGPLTPAQRWVALVFLLTAVGWLSRTAIRIGSLRWPGWSSWFPVPDQLHDATVAMAAALLLMAVPAVAGEGGRRPALRWERVQERTPWGILLLFGGGLALAAGFETTGLASWIGGQLGAFADVPSLLLVAATCLLVTFLTELTSNTATVTMLMPVLAATAAGAGLHPFLLMLPATLSGSCAFMLPVATPPNAVVFGSGWIGIPRMARTGLWLNLAGAVLVTLAVYLLGFPVLGLGGGVPAWVAGAG
jgi:sodium-dependent dicarboxylate transporter 2/3/5